MATLTGDKTTSSNKTGNRASVSNKDQSAERSEAYYRRMVNRAKFFERKHSRAFDELAKPSDG